MKKHSIIPIFIPHNGCKNDCVFCNQKSITARSESPSESQVISIVERNLSTINRANVQTTEIAFFGGSFTGLNMNQQNKYLDIAKRYKDDLKVDYIRISTRPDYIDKEILNNLKEHRVDIIELGAQSFDDQVLKLSGRGHDASCICNAASLIKSHGFKLGIQLMVGLPGDAKEKALYSTEQTISLKPDMARIYPTIVLNDTKLKEMFNNGEYKPFGEDEMIEIVSLMYSKLKENNITVLRVGLKSTDLISRESDLVFNDYHPAFRQLVEGKLALAQMENALKDEMNKNPSIEDHEAEILFYAQERSISSLSGHKKANRIFLKNKYPRFTFRFIGDNSLNDDEIKLKVLIS